MKANICKQWTKVITNIIYWQQVLLKRDTPPYGHPPTYQISLTYLERQNCYGLEKKILFKKQLFDLEVKGRGPTKVTEKKRKKQKKRKKKWEQKSD